MEESQAYFSGPHYHTTSFQKCSTDISGSCSCLSIFKFMQLNHYKFSHARLLCPDLRQNNQKKKRVHSCTVFFLKIAHTHFKIWPTFSGLAHKTTFPLTSS